MKRKEDVYMYLCIFFFVCVSRGPQVPHLTYPPSFWASISVCNFSQFFLTPQIPLHVDVINRWLHTGKYELQKTHILTYLKYARIEQWSSRKMHEISSKLKIKAIEWCHWLRYCRRSHQRCSLKKGVLKNFTKFTGKHLCQSLFLIKLQAWDLQLIEKETLAQVFSCKFWKTCKSTFFTEHLWTTASSVGTFKVKYSQLKTQENKRNSPCVNFWTENTWSWADQYLSQWRHSGLFIVNFE